MENNQEVVLSKVQISEWGKQLGVDVRHIEEVRLFSQAGFALDSYGKARCLNEPEMKMLALAQQQTGLSVMARELYFLGNGIYIPKSSKVKMARRDDVMPMKKVSTRPATMEEREAHGTPNNDPSLTKEYDHLSYAQIYAMIGDKLEVVSDAFGTANMTNIHLKGKHDDPFRLSKDMAETRAISRALSQIYEFFGYASYEEVAQGTGTTEPTVIDIGEAEVVEVKKTQKGVTVKEVLKFIGDNSDALPADLVKKLTEERLSGYTVEGLAKSYDDVKAMIEKAGKVKTAPASESEVAKP